MGAVVPGEAGDPRFFRRSAPVTLAAVAAAAGGTLGPGADPSRMIAGVAPIGAAAPSDVAYLDDPKRRNLLAGTGAGAVILPASLAPHAPAHVGVIVTDRVPEAWARVAALLVQPIVDPPGVHATAVVADGCVVDPSAAVGAYAVLGAGARIGARTTIGPHAAIGPGCVIGADCRLAAHVSVSHALLGDRVVLHPGVRLGQDGFGFTMTERGFVAAPQLGRVVIGDDVDVGANTTIDRGALHDTVIGAGSRLDNLVQIAHNVRLGRCCVIVAQAGISGSTVLEDFVVLGGQSGIVGHLHIGARVRIAAASGVIGDVPAGTDMAGVPALPGREYLRAIATLRRLARRTPRPS